ncbi:MAG TPA: hypothetical protein VK427_01210, partial [Kofleriaceae bacterium]|nr:hypothetical protein [Kofleriaceae bacterium]
ELAGQLSGATTAPDVRRALRRLRADELVRLGVRELERGSDSEVGRELARLADVCFDAAIAFHDRELRARYGAPRYVDDSGVEHDAVLAVIGMGKLGGEELNFSSDVDVIYVYSSDQGSAGTLSLHEYFAKLCLQVTAALAEVTEDDVVFRVDLRLRPEGAKGAIASSLESLERYYETFGRPWERQAWIKARPCAGDPELGAEIMTTLRPFVFPRLVAPTVIDEVRDLNRRIKRELVRPRKGEVTAGFDLKNGEGGIREIEFFVQALQLIHAGKRAALRHRGTLAALDALLFAGLVTEREHVELSQAYRWLRHAEHVLQLEGGLQTQIVPEDDTRREILAKRLGYDSDVQLALELFRHASNVARLFASLGDTEDDANPEITALLSGELSDDEEARLLGQLRFVDVTAAATDLERLRAARHVSASLLVEIAASADPDQALRYLADLIAKRGATWSIWRLIEENAPLMRLLCSLLGASAYLARSLVDTPELIDLLVQLGLTSPSRDATQIAADLGARLASVDATDPEAIWSAVAEVKNGHVLRVGLADFGGALDPL